MYDRRLIDLAIAELKENPEQYAAVHEKNSCVVLAGPGSGKTKTLTVAIARALLEDVEEPRGIACITYNNECAIELEARLRKLGIDPSSNVFIGTVHSFALAHIIGPYARCVSPKFPSDFRVASPDECRAAVEDAYRASVNGAENPHNRWRFAERKRRRDIDRQHPIWRTQNPELAAFIEAYEGILRSRHLIDFDDMPLMAFRMLQKHSWIGKALQARFPVLFVDEYQDLGHALHGLVQKLCFESGIRVLAVGDADQSIYAFTGANPKLLMEFAQRAGVQTHRLQFNYRSGARIISASMAALGEERNYRARQGTSEGEILFRGIDGGLQFQAQYIATQLIPELVAQQTPLERIAILYRTANEGAEVAKALSAAGIPIVRADNQALVRRNSRLSRLIESCAKWSVGGWKDAEPPFYRLVDEAVSLVVGPSASAEARQQIQTELIAFLQGRAAANTSTHAWLAEFREQLVKTWRRRSSVPDNEWTAIDLMIARTDALNNGEDILLGHFGGRIEGSSRLNLSTLHSAKGREFDVVILFAMNNDVLPSWRDTQSEEGLREARRLFYVGVTRARTKLYVVFRANQNSPWVHELYMRSQAGA